MIQLPIEPNLILLQDIFIFEFTKYQKIDFKDFELKMYNSNSLPLHKLNDVFERFDTLEFYARNIGTKKEPRYTRYIFYKTFDNLFFVTRLNDTETINDYIGVNANFRFLFPKTDYTTKIYKVWKTDLKRFATKKKRKQ